jgi:hypothetical protein
VDRSYSNNYSIQYTVLSMWCPTCEETVSDHDTMCTTCGDALVASPYGAGGGGTSTSGASSSAAQQQQQRRDAEARQMDLMAQQVIQMAQQAQAQGQGQHNGAANIHGLADMIPAGFPMNMTGAHGEGGGQGEVWEEAPAEAMNPQASAVNSSSRPTSKECLERIPRITIDYRSSILHEATVSVSMTLNDSNTDNQSWDAMIGELGAMPPYQLECTKGLVVAVANPIHGGGVGDYKGCVVYVDRGGGLTFRQKAEWAQKCGASALLIGNNVSVWPYIMKDSTASTKSSASAHASDEISIPMLMMKKRDARQLKDIIVAQEQASASTNTSSNTSTISKCAIEVTHIRDAANNTNNQSNMNKHNKNKKESYECACVVCRDGFEIGHVVVRLPFCSHVFHEPCALRWLTIHNTCPVCRRELPTDDMEYENERRRVARTHGGAGGGDGDSSTSSNPNNGWETLFFG